VIAGYVREGGEISESFRRLELGHGPQFAVTAPSFEEIEIGWRPAARSGG
jgi:hypothetical protein